VFGKANQSDPNNTYVALDEDSLVDLSEQVTNGELFWRAPTEFEEYVIFATYERYTNQRSCLGRPVDVIANGSWVTDHFSAAGAKLVTEFWESNLLGAQIRELLKLVGQHSEFKVPLHFSLATLSFPGQRRKGKDNRMQVISLSVP